MNSLDKGKKALVDAISYFSERGFHIFIPVGNNAGAIDLVVTNDGICTVRIQCKYTQRRHSEMNKRNPDCPVWEVGLGQAGSDKQLYYNYTPDSFDLLFISTPDSHYLIPWKEFCEKLGKVPKIVRLGKKNDRYKI